MSVKKLKKRLSAYVKFKDLAKSIKLVALSQLNNLKNKISSRGIPLSSIVPFFNKRNYIRNYEKCLIMPIGVDKSRCGPHNGNIIKKAKKLIEQLEDAGKRVSIFTIGNRMKDFFKKYYYYFYYKNAYNVDKEPLSLTTSFVITEKLLNKRFDRYFFVFNRYYSPFEQKTSIYELTGFSDFYNICLDIHHKRKWYGAADFFAFIHNIEAGTLESNLYDIYFHSLSMFVLDTLEENEYSSLGARVTAMDNSQQNAAKLIDVLNLLYNKARQAAITNELIEIVSAANFV